MRPNGIVASLLLTLQATVPGVALAQTLQLSPSAVSPVITHRFYGTYATDSQALTFSNSVVQLKDYSTIQLTINAPAGQAWLLTSPKHGPSLQETPELRFSFNYGRVSGAPFAQVNSASLDFSYVQGGAALPSAPRFLYVMIPNSGNSFQLEGSVLVNENVAFTNFTMTVNFDNSLLAPAPLDAFFDSNLLFSYNNLSSDPGQQLRLVSVPPPIRLLWQTVRFPTGDEVLVLDWSNPLFSLQAAPTATGLYTNIPGATSPYAMSTSGQPVFFRLQAIY